MTWFRKSTVSVSAILIVLWNCPGHATSRQKDVFVIEGKDVSFIPEKSVKEKQHTPATTRELGLSGLYAVQNDVRFVWAEVANSAQYTAAAWQWLNMADKADSDCTRTYCEDAVYFKTPGARRIEGVQVCERVKIEEITSPPKDCRPVLYLNNGKLFILVTESSGKPQNFQVYFLASAALSDIRIFYPKDRSKHVLQAILNAFKSQPMAMRTSVAEDRLVAVSGQRISRILRPYREDISIIAVMRDRQRNNVAEKLLTVYPTIYVNRYNTSNHRDWHMPTRQQQFKYVNAIFTAVRSAVGSICGKEWSLGDDLIGCDVSQLQVRVFTADSN